MFRIRIFTPEIVDDAGWRHAGAELVVGDARRWFLLDLTHWDIPAYQRQWREGIARLVRGASSSALMSAYRGPGKSSHVMWALWRSEGHVYVQAHTVLPEESDCPFDPALPYAHVGERIPAGQLGLPIPEWRVSLSELAAADLGRSWSI